MKATTPAVSPPVPDAYDRLSAIPTSIPPVNPEVLTLKHSNFLAQRILEEVDLQPTSDRSYDHVKTL